MENITLDKATIAEILKAKYNLSIKSVFVPFSLSRNAAEKNPSLNWRVTLCKGDREILTTDYMAGCAHCPSYEQFSTNAPRAKAVDAECETGRAHRINAMHPILMAIPILPDTCDVIHSLVMDADCLNASTFEEWANDFGYDTDSRKAEAMYRACLEIALKLRNGLGETVLSELRDLFQDY